jgi:hypothetical protein
MVGFRSIGVNMLWHGASRCHQRPANRVGGRIKSGHDDIVCPARAGSGGFEVDADGEAVLAAAQNDAA